MSGPSSDSFEKEHGMIMWCRLQIKMVGERLSAYQFCGYTGFVLSTLLAALLVIGLEMSLLLLTGMVMICMVTFLSLAMLTKIVIGKERLVYYHHEIAILLVQAGLLAFLHMPILPYLDIAILGIGAFLFCGRIGCFMVGCCHGKPHQWGVRYGEEHRKAGFTPYLVGVKVFPVQLLESLFVLFVVIFGTELVLSGPYRSGDALTWYIIAYGTARFFFEFLRGDPERPYFSGFSEAQWTSLILMSLVVLGEFTGKIPFHSWHAGPLILIIAAMVVLTVMRKFNKAEAFNILFPRHIQEVARAVDEAATCICTQAHISVGCTSLGYKISGGRIETPTDQIHHYAFSNKKGNMSEKAARALFDLTLRLKHPGSTAEAVSGRNGVFHLLVSA